MKARPDPTGAAALAARQLALFYPTQSYGPYGLDVNRPQRRPQPIPPAVPPVTEAGVALWPDWTVISVEALDLDAFDDDGGQILPEGGEQ